MLVADHFPELQTTKWKVSHDSHLGKVSKCSSISGVVFGASLNEKNSSEFEFLDPGGKNPPSPPFYQDFLTHHAVVNIYIFSDVAECISFRCLRRMHKGTSDCAVGKLRIDFAWLSHYTEYTDCL